MRRAAIVGCGDVSVIHVEAIQAIDDIELVAVCDLDPDRLEQASSAWGAAGYTDLHTMIAEARPDVVHVTTPHHQHVQVSIDCLEAGVHVIQEKPIAHTLGEGQRLVDAAAHARSKIGICFQNRYNISSQEARRILDSGELGRIEGAYASVVWSRTPEYYLAKPWRGTWDQAGGGVLINQAIHTVDLVQWLMGDVVDVNGNVATRKFPDVIEVEDTADALLTHANGTQTTFFAALTAPVHRPVEIEIYAEHGVLAIRNGLEVAWKHGGVDVYPERSVSSVGRTYWGVSHEILIRDFYKKLDDPEPFWISPAEAMASLEILKTMYRQTYGNNQGE
ncbi:MAG: Gfo/Idh/MocA family oxidoreductase [Actinomycetales bacterium]|nr:Gfo/Idh/MocA family oxidoreductase [Actinomycetales bacterium]